MLTSLQYSVQKYLRGLLHFVYPEYCVVCAELLPEGMQDICIFCEDSLMYTYYEKFIEDSPLDELFYGRAQLESTFSLLNFSRGTSTRKIVHQIKYKNNKPLAHFMGRKMGRALHEKWKEGFPDVLIPVPLHPKKFYLRGYNQSELLAKGVAHETGIKVLVSILKRRVHTQTQTKKGKYARWDNVEDIFTVNHPLRWKNKHICIIDDVITTGSTLESCIRKLKEEIPGVKISVISLAMAKK